jgi:hypothetical protein
MIEGSGSIPLTNESGSATLKSMLSCVFAGEAVQGHQAEGEEQGGRPELSQKENGNYRGAPEPGTVPIYRESANMTILGYSCGLQSSLFTENHRFTVKALIFCLERSIKKVQAIKVGKILT